MFAMTFTVHTIPVKCPTGDAEYFMLGSVFLVASAIIVQQ